MVSILPGVLGRGGRIMKTDGPIQIDIHLKPKTETLHKLDGYVSRNNTKRNTLLNAIIARGIDRLIMLELAQQEIHFEDYE